MIKLLLTKTNKIDLIINLISYIRIKFYYQKTNLLYKNGSIFIFLNFINILLSNSFTKSVKIKIKKKIYLFVFMLSDLKGVSVFVEN